MYFICFKGTQTHRQKPLSSFTSSFPKGKSQEKGQTETGTCEFHLGLSSGWQKVNYRSHDQPPLRAHSSMKLEESPHVNPDVLPWDVSTTATSQLLGQMPVPTFFFWIKYYIFSTNCENKLIKQQSTNTRVLNSHKHLKNYRLLCTTSNIWNQNL